MSVVIIVSGWIYTHVHAHAHAYTHTNFADKSNSRSQVHDGHRPENLPYVSDLWSIMYVSEANF